MNVQKFNQLLADNPGVGLYVMLPSGEFVPDHFHITEVGRVEKQFVDCGGTRREAISCVLQVWVANDKDHRLQSTKLGKIMNVAAPLLAGDPVGDVEVTPKGLLLILGSKPTACLAPEKCGVKGCC